MIISGYTFVRNAVKLAYPLQESILSILDLVDEYVVAWCPGDADDNTLEVLQNLNHPKIKLIEAAWEPEKFRHNTLYAYLSDVAKSHCRGDWLFYLQTDEVVHEKYLPVIRQACRHYAHRPDIEGLLFHYRHFWGDYNHCFTHHGWYPREIRIIRNLPQIHSWRDAQSFRYYDRFTPSTADYLRKDGTRKLNVALLPAEIYHYGWVRPPHVMSDKQNRMSRTSSGTDRDIYTGRFDYGPLNRVPRFAGTHPAVMHKRLAAFNWGEALQYEGRPHSGRPLHKHERLKYRLRTWLELNLLNGREIGGFRNYRLAEKFTPG